MKELSNPLIRVGTSPEAINSAKDAIISILECGGAEQETKRIAISALKDICSVNNTTITGCNLTQNIPPHTD